MIARTIDDGLDQATRSLNECGYDVFAYRMDPAGNPGIVVVDGSGLTVYETTSDVLVDPVATDDWITIVETLCGGVRA